MVTGVSVQLSFETDSVQEANDLVPPSTSTSLQTPIAQSPNTLHPANNLLNADVSSGGESSRSRSSSFAGASMLSGETALPDASIVALDTIPDEEALRPDPGTESFFEVADNRFAYSPGQLNKFLNPKSLQAFRAVGGIRGLEKGLRSDLTTGLSIDEGVLEGTVTLEEAKAAAKRKAANIDGDEARRIATAASAGYSPDGDMQRYVDRKRVFGDNSLPQKKGKSLLLLLWEQYNDKILWMLTGAAVISLALGIYETVGVDHPEFTCSISSGIEVCARTPPPVDWVEGVAICVAIIIVVLVGALNDYQKERQFVKLNAKVWTGSHAVSRESRGVYANGVSHSRKRTALSRRFEAESRSRSRFTMLWSVMFCISNQAT